MVLWCTNQKANYWGEIIQTQIKDVAATTIEDSVKHTDLYLYIIQIIGTYIH